MHPYFHCLLLYQTSSVQYAIVYYRHMNDGTYASASSSNLNVSGTSVSNSASFNFGDKMT